MPENLERFEQRRPQRPVLPRGVFDDNLEQSALLRGGLPEEQLARPARQIQHVVRLIDWSRGGLLDILNLAQQFILVPAPSRRMLVEELLPDSPMEFVQIHGLNARFNLIVLSPQLLEGLRAGRLLDPVGGEHGLTEPIEDRLRNNQVIQNFGKFVGQNFLARVPLWALSAITRAVVIHVRSLFQLAHK